MKLITNKDQDFLKKALKTDKEVNIRGKWIVPDSGMPPYQMLRLIAFDEYPEIKDNNTVSVTTLNVPHKINWFRKHFPDEMVTDIGQGMASMLGTALHLLAEKANRHFGGESSESELMLSAPVGNYQLRGILDHIEDGVNCDYKTNTISVMIPFYDVNKSEDKPDYVRQVKMQMWLARQNGIQADFSFILNIGRDYSGAMKMQHGIDAYWPPKWQRHVYEYDAEIEQWIHDRVHQHFDVLSKEHEEDVPECTPEDRWARGESWGVYKTNNGVPNKRCINGGRIDISKFGEHSARIAEERRVAAGPNNHIVVHTPAVNVRCESWCPARFICKQKARMDAEASQ